MARGRRARADNKNPETIMSMHRSFTAALWLLAAAGAYAMAVSWADAAQTGRLQPWVLVVVFWAAAAVSVTIHRLSHYLADELAQLPQAFRHPRRGLGYARHIVGPSRRHLARGLGTLDSLFSGFLLRASGVRAALALPRVGAVAPKVSRVEEEAGGPQSWRSTP
jgi:hypothetical protein